MRAIMEFIPSMRPEVSRYRKKLSTCCACLESVFANRLNGFRVDASANAIHSPKAVAHFLKLENWNTSLSFSLSRYASSHIACLADVENKPFVSIFLITGKGIRFWITVTKEKWLRKALKLIFFYLPFKLMTRTKTLWAILFSIMVVPSCNHWRKIDIDARDSSLQYAFTLVTEEKNIV